MRSRKPLLAGLTTAALLFQLFAIPGQPVSAADAAKVKLRILETTDIHVNLLDYDYYSDQEIETYGLARTATLIKKARSEATNSLLFDNGDLIQGNPLGDYVAKVKPLKGAEVHPVYKAMNLLDYDAATLGNHEFNYGLDFLNQTLKGAEFPYVNANIYKDDGDKDESNDVNYFKPYEIIEKKVKDESGKEHTLKVGVIGLVTPQIMQWDSSSLTGKVIAKDIVKTAAKFVPEMKEKGADLIVALAHTGYDQNPPADMAENAVLPLSEVDGIDAILFGHAHKVFPGSAFADQKGVNLEKGTINGVAAVEPGAWGDNLGVIDLQLEQANGKWKVVDSKSVSSPIYDAANKKAFVEADKEIVAAISDEHKATVDYVRGPVGTTTAPITSYFALVQDDPSIQIVTNAQKWYIENKLKGTKYEGTPVLSAGAPFKAGGRMGADYYTDIPTGTIAIKNVADLYVYPNTLHAVEVNGAEIKEWLEWSAGQFNQIDPNKSGEQELVNLDFPTYNFDVIDGVTYEIDVTQPSKYDAKGNVVNASANRIKNLQFEGKAIDLQKKFIVATNNYRAGSSKLANPDGKRIVLAAPDESRQVIIDYITENKTINPSADGNWSFAAVSGNPEVIFNTATEAKKLVESDPELSKVMTYLGEGKDGFGKYALNLASDKAAAPAPEPNPAPTPTPTPEKPVTPVQPSKPEKPSKPEASKDKVHVVKKGDNLYRIGLKYGVDWNAIVKANQISNVYTLQVGQKLIIPAS